MKRIVLFLIVFFSFIGCDNSDPTVSNQPGGGGSNGNYWIEFLPIVSYDRQEVYLVVWDTAANVYSGIYRASVSDPIREMIASVDSAIIGIQSGTLVYYKGIDGKMYEYDTENDSTSLSTLDYPFINFFTVNDSLLGSSFGGFISCINVKTESVSVCGYGRLPTLYNKDTLLYLRSLPNHEYEMILYDAAEKVQDDTLIFDTIVLPGLPHSFGIEPIQGRIVFSILSPEGYEIYTYDPKLNIYTKIATSIYHYVAMIDANTLLFTGDDGRLYRSNMDGSSVYPFWGIEE